jgi:hypothetical protein
MCPCYCAAGSWPDTGDSDRLSLLLTLKHGCVYARVRGDCTTMRSVHQKNYAILQHLLCTEVHVVGRYRSVHRA